MKVGILLEVPMIRGCLVQYFYSKNGEFTASALQQSGQLLIFFSRATSYTSIYPGASISVTLVNQDVTPGSLLYSCSALAKADTLDMILTHTYIPKGVNRQ